METEKLLENFEKYSSLFRKYFPCAGASKLLDDLGVRITTAPRGMKEDEGGSPGSLVDFSLRVTLIANDHSKLFEARQGENSVDRKSVARISLAHELGKIGSESEDLFVPQESQWHREKLGQRFKYNENCPKMSVGHRSLFHLQNYGIRVTPEEWLSILVAQGLHFPENAFYGNSLPTEGKILHFARSIALDHNI